MSSSSSSTPPTSFVADAFPTFQDFWSFTPSEITRSGEVLAKYFTAFINLLLLAFSPAPTISTEKVKPSATDRDLMKRMADCLARHRITSSPELIFQNIHEWIKSMIIEDPHLLRYLFFLVCPTGNDVVRYKTEAAKPDNSVTPKWDSFVTTKDNETHALRDMWRLKNESPSVFILPDLPQQGRSANSAEPAAASVPSSPVSAYSGDASSSVQQELGEVTSNSSPADATAISTESLAFFSKKVVDAGFPSAFLASATRYKRNTSETFPISEMKKVYQVLKQFGIPGIQLDFENEDPIHLVQLIRSIRSSPDIILKWPEMRVQLIPLLNGVFLSSKIPLPFVLNTVSFDEYFKCILQFSQLLDQMLRQRLVPETATVTDVAADSSPSPVVHTQYSAPSLKRTFSDFNAASLPSESEDKRIKLSNQREATLSPRSLQSESGASTLNEENSDFFRLLNNQSPGYSLPFSKDRSDDRSYPSSPHSSCHENDEFMNSVFHS